MNHRGYNILCSDSNNVFYNISLEQNLLKTKSNYIFLYTNSPSIVLGRNQNIFKEVNRHILFSDEFSNIRLARRLSGGGTVYHDFGNINISIIEDCPNSIDYKYAIQLLIDFLKDVYNIDGVVFHKNGLFLGDKKFSGIAAYKKGNRSVIHYTVLVESDIKMIDFIVKNRINSNIGVNSRISNVMNLSKLIELGVSKFESDLLSYLKSNGNIEIRCPIADSNSNLEDYEWIVGKFGDFTFSKKDLSISVRKGMFSELKINDITENLSIQNLRFNLETIKKISEEKNIDLIGAIL